MSEAWKKADASNCIEYTPFSVAMSVYRDDNPFFFDIALESITTKQTTMPDEIVLVVDGPVSDEINAVIEKHRSALRNMNIIRLPQNGGLGNALRIAIVNSKYNLVARMDSDDVAVRDRFEQQLHFFNENPNIDILGGDITEFIEATEKSVAYRRVPNSDASIKDYLKRRCPFNHVTVMYKKSAVLSAGGYKDLYWNEDYYLWIRMAEHGCVMANTGTVLVSVRVGKDMYNRRGGKRYFRSEKFLQQYMLENGMIGKFMYYTNLAKRLVVQVVLPNSIRGWVFRRFARERV